MNLQKINVDFDDLKDLKSKINMLQNVRKKLLLTIGNYDQVSFGTSKLNVNDVLDIFEILMNIKYEGDCGGEYYVYLHCNPLKKVSLNRDIREILLATKFNVSYLPIYVGKGIGNRCFDLNRNDSHRKIRTQIKEQNKDLEVIKIIEGLSEKEALFEEQKMICLLGLISLNKEGMLVNLQTEKNEIIEIFRKEIQNTIFKEERINKKAMSLIKLISKWV